MARSVEIETPPASRCPDSDEDRRSILEELDAILASSHFRGSKRYPALLKFIVDAALDNRSSQLKERILGVEVFGRDPGYDTSADPVVRISAGEVRKRIAQFYHENGRPSRFQIELPLGSYAPEFRLREPDPVPVRYPSQTPSSQTPSSQPLPSQPPLSHDPLPAHAPRRHAGSPIAALTVLVLALVLAAAAVLTSIRYRPPPAPVTRPAILDDLWAPMLLQTARPALIVLRTVPAARVQPGSEPLTLGDHVHYVSVSMAISLAHITSVLGGYDRSYEIKEAPETTVTDIRSRPVIAIGAKDNDWTMRLLRPLRFHFVFFPDGMERIEDSANPGQTAWEFNRHSPYSSVTADYAIVARFHDATTEGPVMVVAGLGFYGTEAAGEFVQSPQYVAQLAKALPPGWKNRNFELVLRTDVIGYHAGPPILLSAITW